MVAVLPILSLVGATGGLTGLVLAGGASSAVAAFNYFINSTRHRAPVSQMSGPEPDPPPSAVADRA